MQPPRVLWVDDLAGLEDYSISVRDNLQRHGLEVFLERSAKEAMRRIADESFDALILDLMMPPGDFSDVETARGTSTGLRLLSYVRELGKRVPVLILSGRGTFEGEEERIKALGAKYMSRMRGASTIAGALKKMLEGS